MKKQFFLSVFLLACPLSIFADTHMPDASMIARYGFNHDMEWMYTDHRRYETERALFPAMFDFRVLKDAPHDRRIAPAIPPEAFAKQK